MAFAERHENDQYAPLRKEAFDVIAASAKAKGLGHKISDRRYNGNVYGNNDGPTPMPTSDMGAELGIDPRKHIMLTPNIDYNGSNPIELTNNYQSKAQDVASMLESAGIQTVPVNVNNRNYSGDNRARILVDVTQQGFKQKLQHMAGEALAHASTLTEELKTAALGRDGTQRQR